MPNYSAHEIFYWKDYEKENKQQNKQKQKYHDKISISKIEST